MKSILTTIVAVALAAPAFANPGNGGNPCGGNCGNPGGNIQTGGTFEGSARSISTGGSFAASGGIAAGGMSGGSFVRNEQQAGQLSGAHASFTPGADGARAGTLVTETLTDGFSQARTITRSNGEGTIGAGAGFSANFGDAEAFGNFRSNW